MNEQIDLTAYTDSQEDQVTEWVEKRLGDIFENIYSGGTPKKGRKDYYNGEIPFVKIEDLNRQQGEGVSTAEEFITEKAVSDTSTRAFDAGTLLLTIYGSLAETAIVHDRVATNQAILGMWGADEDNTLYVRYAIDNTQAKLESLSRQTTQANLGKGIVQKHRLPIPPLTEQRKIATVLYTVDRAIEKTEDIVQQSKQTKEGLVKEIVTGGIGAEEHQTMRVGPHEFEIPVYWDVVSISESCENLDSERIPVSKSNREDMQGEIPYYGASGCVDYVDDYLFDEPLILLAEDGENLRSRTQRVAFKITGKSWVNNHAHVLRPKDGFELDYLVEYLERLDYRPYVSGSAQPKLNQTMLNKITVPKPPLEEQKEIASILNEFKNQITHEAEYLDQLKRFKRGLMQDLLSGTVRTTDTNIEVPEEIAQYG